MTGNVFRERGRSGSSSGGLGGASGGGQSELQLQRQRLTVRRKALQKKLSEVFAHQLYIFSCSLRFAQFCLLSNTRSLCLLTLRTMLVPTDTVQRVWRHGTFCY